MAPYREPIKTELEIQEAGKLGNLEVWRLGGLVVRNRGPMSPSWEPIKRDLETQEAWKLGNLEVWRLGGLAEVWRLGGLGVPNPGGQIVTM